MGCWFDLNKEKRRKVDAELFDKKAPKIDDFRRFLAPSARFERAAFRLGGERSILLSYEGTEKHDEI